MGYFKSKLKDCPFEKLIFIKVTICSSPLSSLFKDELLILKFIIIVRHFPISILLFEKSTSKLLFPGQAK